MQLQRHGRPRLGLARPPSTAARRVQAQSAPPASSCRAQGAAARLRARRARFAAAAAADGEGDSATSSPPPTAAAAQPPLSSSSPEPPSGSAEQAGEEAGERKLRTKFTPEKLEKVTTGLNNLVEDLRDDIRDKFSARVFISLLVQLGGLKGSLAVGVAYLIGVDPFGNFALSPTDVGIGLALSLPIFAYDAALMLPDWSADGADAGSPSAAAAPAGSAAQQQPLARARAAAALYQRIKVSTNVGSKLQVWQELVVIGVAHFADEMLARAVFLGGLAGWARDRLLEADVDVVTAAGAAPWLALALTFAAEVARKRRALFRRVTIGAVRMEQNKVTGEQQVTPLSEEELARLQQRSGKEGEQAARIAAQIAEARERGLTVAQFDAIREMGEWACLGAAWAVTGNLAASVAASVVGDVAFSASQRLASRRLRKRELAAQTVRLKSALRQMIQEVDGDEPPPPPPPGSETL